MKPSKKGPNLEVGVLGSHGQTLEAAEWRHGSAS